MIWVQSFAGAVTCTDDEVVGFRAGYNDVLDDASMGWCVAASRGLTFPSLWLLFACFCQRYSTPCPCLSLVLLSHVPASGVNSLSVAGMQGAVRALDAGVRLQQVGC